MLRRLAAAIFLLSISYASQAVAQAVPPLSVELIIQYGLTGSDRVALLDAELITKDNAKLQVAAPLMTGLGAKAAVADNRFETSGGAFSPERTKSDSVTFSAQKAFATGTRVGSEVIHRRTDSDFPSSTGGLSFSPTAEFAETQLTLTVRQSLWQNSFGKNFERGFAAAALTEEALLLNNLSAKEDLALEYAQQYFQAWLAKAQWQSAKAQLSRQKRLLEVTKIKRSRGTAETPDVLQVETTLINSEQTLADAKQALVDIWQALVISLKLPSTYLAVDPTTIEMRLDSGSGDVNQTCKRVLASESGVRETAALRALDKLKEGSSLSMATAVDQQRPDLFVEARVAGNGIDDDRLPTVEEGVSFRHPQWSIGVGIEVQLGHYEEKARYLEAFKQKTLSELRRSQLTSTLRVQWRQSCSELARLAEKLVAQENVYTLQVRRSKLEDDRFRLAQVDVFNVIQAEADVIGAELSLQRTKAQLQATVFKIRKLNDELALYLKAPK